MKEDQIKQIITKAVQAVAKGHKVSAVPAVSLEMPRDRSHGDYATNIALVFAKTLGKDPLSLAEEIVSRIDRGKGIDKAEVSPPGFINLSLSRDAFVEQVREILKVEDYYGRNSSLWGKKMAVEYTDPNPFKEFHLGHFMSNSIGESISRILEFQGCRVKRFCYQGDVGLHAAKAVWGLMKLSQSNAFPEDNAFLKSKMKFLGMAYALGSQEYEKNDVVKQEIIELNRKIYEGSDREVNKFYDRGKVWSLEHFNEVYVMLGTSFDFLVFESELINLAKKIVNDGLKKKIFEKSQGAIIFKGEDHGLHTRVFINAQGFPTYEAKELALATLKYRKFTYDWSIVVTGNEINDYFKVLLFVMGKLFPQLAERTLHVGHGMFRLPEGKMSSRTGNVVTFESLLEQLERIVEERVKDRDLSESERREVMQKVAVAALRYSILKQAAGSDVIYDPEKAASFEGDSGPYLQYAYARATSVIRKAQDEELLASTKNPSSEASSFEKLIVHFPEVVKRAGEQQEPHYIALYLTELAREFNAFYAQNTIVDKNDPFSPYKIALTEAFLTTMSNGLWLLGIPVLEKM